MVLAADVSFRGSLGEAKNDRAGFEDYLDSVHRGFADYHCEIDALVVDGDLAFARMTFSGLHQGTVLGYPPTGRNVSWSGAALFTFKGDLITDLWVLGDLRALEGQLSEAD